MLRFDKAHGKELDACIRHSQIHDAEIRAFRYDKQEQIATITIETVNPIFGDRMQFTFWNVKAVLSVCGSEPRGGETILSMSVQVDDSYLKNRMRICGDAAEDNLYILFQMLSGGELHILSKEVFAEITVGNGT